MKQKGFALIYVLVGVIILAVSGGAYFGIKKNIIPFPFKQNPVFCTEDAKQCPNGSYVGRDSLKNCEFKPCPSFKPTPSPQSSETSIKTEDETANWKTYTNTKLGFSFKYPPEASVTESKPGEIHVRYTEQCFACQVNPGYGVSFDIKNLNLKNLKEVVKEELERDKDSWRNLSSLSEIKVGDYSGYTYSIKSKVGTKRIYLSHTTDDTYIQISYGSQYEDSRGYQQKIDQILSTFKFLDQKICEIDKEYQNTAVNPLECTCPKGTKQTIVSTGWGSCPREGMKDCPATVVKCKR